MTPQTLESSRVKYGVLLVVLGGACGFFSYGAVVDPVPLNQPLVVVVLLCLIAISGGWALFSAYRLFAPSKLVLDGAGFTYSCNGKRWHCPWGDARNFRKCVQYGTRGYRRAFVAYNRRIEGRPPGLPIAGFLKTLTGEPDAMMLPENYSLPPANLAELMNQWRAAAAKIISTN